MDTNNLFPNSTLATYSSQILAGTFYLTNGANTYSTNIGVTLDTGATPTLHDFTNDTSPITNYFSTVVTEENTNYSIIEGIQLGISSVETNGATLSIYNMTTGIKDETNYVGVQFGTNFYINMGANLFYEYDILYDMQNGVLGFRQVPEANQAVLMLGGILALIFFSLFQSVRQRRQK